MDLRGKLVTIFGGGGFVGHATAQALMDKGARVRVAGRDPNKAWPVKALGTLGQSQFVLADITKPATVERAVAASDVVINLVGILDGNFEAVHVRGAENVAAAAASAGTKTLIHMSAIGADSESDSAYGRSKAQGEEKVLAAFPGARIIRPSIIFGRRDDFTNMFAKIISSLPIVPVIAPSAQFQPVWVEDVAAAISAAVEREDLAGTTIWLGGPETVTMLELNKTIAAMLARGPVWFEVPDAIAGGAAGLLGWLPGAPMTSDQWKMLQTPNVIPVEGDVTTITELGIRPVPLVSVMPEWIDQYRKAGRFSRVPTS